MVKSFHRHIKTALKARLRGPDWIDKLPWVLLGIRTVPKEDSVTSSAELVHGAPLTVPGNFIVTPHGREDPPATVLSGCEKRLGRLPQSLHLITVSNQGTSRLPYKTIIMSSSTEMHFVHHSRSHTRVRSRYCSDSLKLSSSTTEAAARLSRLIA